MTGIIGHNQMTAHLVVCEQRHRGRSSVGSVSHSTGAAMGLFLPMKVFVLC
jgi:hypothetical protein